MKFLKIVEITVTLFVILIPFSEDSMRLAYDLLVIFLGYCCFDFAFVSMHFTVQGFVARTNTLVTYLRSFLTEYLYNGKFENGLYCCECFLR